MEEKIDISASEALNKINNGLILENFYIKGEFNLRMLINSSDILEKRVEIENCIIESLQAHLYILRTG